MGIGKLLWAHSIGNFWVANWLLAGYPQNTETFPNGTLTGGLRVHPPIYLLISMVTVDKHYRIRCTDYAPELLIPELFGHWQVNHEPPERVPLGAG